MPYLGIVLSGLVLLSGIILLVEMGYHFGMERANGTVTKLFGLSLDTGAAPAWVIAVAVLLIGALAFERMRRYFKREWSLIQDQIESAAQAGRD